MNSVREVRRQTGALWRVLMAGCLCLGWASAAHALDLGAESEFSVAPQRLTTALVEFSRQCGAQVMSNTDKVEKLETGGVSGKMTLRAGLIALLQGTGLEYKVTGRGAIVVGEFATEAGQPDSTTEAEPASNSTLSEVLVQGARAEGTKGGAPLIEVPQSVSVVSRKMLEAQGAQRIEQALRYTAGVSTGFAIDNRADLLTVRGFDQTRSGNYLDNLRLSFNSSAYSDWNVEPYGLDRVEVLRGPSSVLYGQGSPGGVVNSISKRPTSTAQRELMLSVGNHDRYQAAFDVGGPIDAEERWLYRVVALDRDSGTQVHYVNDDRTFIAPSLTWKPSGSTSLTLMSDFLSMRTGSTIGFLPAEGLILPNPNGRIRSSFFIGERDFDNFDIDRYSLGYQLRHDTEHWSLRQNARYGYQTLDYKALYGAGFEADLRTLNRGSLISDEKVESFVLDNQAQRRFGGGRIAHDVLLGIDFQWTAFDIKSGYGPAPSIDAYAPVYGQPVVAPIPGVTSGCCFGVDTAEKLKQFGLYVQDQVKIDSKWVFTLGARHDRAKFSSLDRSGDFLSELSDTAFTGRVGVVYLSENGLAPYVSYSGSFLPVLGRDFDGKPFEPETARQYEVGLKYQPPGAMSLITLSLYDLRRQKVLTPDPDPEHREIDPFAQVQTGEIGSRGIELEGRLNPIEGLDVSAAYTYLDAEVLESNEGDEGLRPPFVPKTMASVWTEYLIPRGSLRKLGFGIGVRYLGSTLNGANDLTVPSVTLADAVIHYNWGRARVALNASNVFDKDYTASCDSFNTCYHGVRRTILGSVTWRW